MSFGSTKSGSTGAAKGNSFCAASGGNGNSAKLITGIPKIKFRQIPFQMLLADVVIRAVNAALQNGEIALNRIRVCTTANIFASAVIDGFVLLKIGTDGFCDKSLIGHHGGLAMHLRL